MKLISGLVKLISGLPIVPQDSHWNVESIVNNNTFSNVQILIRLSPYGNFATAKAKTSTLNNLAFTAVHETT